MDIFNPSSTSTDGLEFEYEEEKKVILVVDDNATTLRGIKNILEKHYEVILANSGTKAIAQISRKKPDLILLDYDSLSTKPPLCTSETEGIYLWTSDDQAVVKGLLFLAYKKLRQFEEVKVSIKLVILY